MKSLKVMMSVAVLLVSQASLAVDYNDINLSPASNLPCNHRNPAARTEVTTEQSKVAKQSAVKKTATTPASSTKGVK